MKKFTVPAPDEMSAHNQAILASLEKAIGFRPNLYSYIARNETALGDYMTLQNRKTTLSAKEREIINLVVSQVNGCEYCLAAHTAIGKMIGFTPDQILEIRSGRASFDEKLDALARFVRATAVNRGKPSPDATEALFAAGYGEANLIDIVIAIGDKVISNYLHGITRVPVDFPPAPELPQALAGAAVGA